jgi:LytTr DNA-binding domain
MAEKLKPYGFIRIHRSVVVNISAVEEIQPLPTGECRLRVKGGRKYFWNFADGSFSVFRTNGEGGIFQPRGTA